MARVGRTLARLCGVAVLRAVVVLLTFGATAAVAGAAWSAQDVAISMNESAPAALTISGNVSGLVPGAHGAVLRLTLHNLSADPAPATTVTAAVENVSHAPATCAGALSLGAWHGAVTVAPHGTATVTLPIALAAGSPATCAGATWGLRYTAY